MPTRAPRKNSIFSHAYYDAVFILLPALAALAVFTVVPSNAVYLVLLAVVSVLDSGHVYLTLWRTWWHTGLKNKPQYFYTIPLLVFIGVFFWNFLGIPFLWMFVVYFTVYHNVRQLYGINKWYQNIEQRFDRVVDYFLYAICGLSFLALHFKPGFHFVYYTGKDLLVYPEAALFLGLKAVVLLLFGLYLLYELMQFNKTKAVLVPRVLFVISGMNVYIAAFLFADNELQLLAPLIVTHSLHYLALIVLTGSRTHTLLKQSLWKAAGLVIFSLLLFGFFEFFVEKNYLDFLSHSFLGSLLIAVYLVPLLSHFILDAIIWKSNYPEFKEFLSAEVGVTGNKF